MSDFPGASYDAWKTTEPDNDPPPVEADEDEDAVESGDEDYAWEREPLCTLMDEEIDSV